MPERHWNVNAKGKVKNISSSLLPSSVWCARMRHSFTWWREKKVIAVYFKRKDNSPLQTTGVLYNFKLTLRESGVRRERSVVWKGDDNIPYLPSPDLGEQIFCLENICFTDLLSSNLVASCGNKQFPYSYKAKKGNRRY